MIELDPKTGSFKADFEVTLEGGDLVFRPTRTLDVGHCGPNQVERYGIVEEFMGLVIDPHKGRRYEFGFGGPVYVQHESQYELVDSSGRDILRLARRTGPLFGKDLSETGARFANGAIREPLSWWVSAAGCLRFAAECAAAIDDPSAAESLDDEITVGASLFFRNGSPGMLITTMYAPDQGFPGDYGIMLQSSRAGQQHALLSERGKHGDRDTLVASGFGSSKVYRETRREVMSGARTMPSYGDAAPIGSESLRRIVNRLLRRSDSVDQNSVELVEATPVELNGALYVIRYDSADNSSNLMGLFNPYEKPDELSNAFGISMAIPNREVLSEDGWRRLYGDLYDASVKLHTNRSAPDLRRGQDADPFYANMLERIWCSFARLRVGRSVRICPQCLRTFFADNRRQFCSDSCRNSFNKHRAREREKLAKMELSEFLRSTMVPGNRYSEEELCEAFNEQGGTPITSATVKARLEELKRAGRVRRSPGQGKVWEIVR